MKRYNALRGLGMAALLALTVLGCNSSTSNPPATTPKPILDPIKDNGGQAAGTYCFMRKAENVGVEGRMTYDQHGIAEGNLRGTKIDPQDGYESNFNTSFKGSLRGDTLFLDVTSDETGGRESFKAKWIWRDSTLQEGSNIMRQIPCK